MRRCKGRWESGAAGVARGGQPLQGRGGGSQRRRHLHRDLLCLLRHRLQRAVQPQQPDARRDRLHGGRHCCSGRQRGQGPPGSLHPQRPGTPLTTTGHAMPLHLSSLGKPLYCAHVSLSSYQAPSDSMLVPVVGHEWPKLHHRLGVTKVQACVLV